MGDADSIDGSVPDIHDEEAMTLETGDEPREIAQERKGLQRGQYLREVGKGVN